MIDVRSALKAELPETEELEKVVSLLKLTRQPIEVELQGMSMGAFMPKGSRIRLRTVRGHTPAVGDIVIFIWSRNLTVHRVLYQGRLRSRHYLITRGDANCLCDPPVHVDKVLGIVEAIQLAGYWAAPRSSVQRSIPKRVLAFVVLLGMCITMEIHVGLARRLAEELIGLKSWYSRIRASARDHAGSL